MVRCFEVIKDGWKLKHSLDDYMGGPFERWYLKAPSGNVYFMYRVRGYQKLGFEIEFNNDAKSLFVGNTFNEDTEKIYDIEKKGKYDKQLSEEIVNSEDYQLLFGAKEGDSDAD